MHSYLEAEPKTNDGDRHLGNSKWRGVGEEVRLTVRSVSPAATLAAQPADALLAMSHVHPKPVLEVLNRAAIPRQKFSSSSVAVQKDARPRVALPLPLK